MNFYFLILKYRNHDLEQQEHKLFSPNKVIGTFVRLLRQFPAGGDTWTHHG